MPRVPSCGRTEDVPVEEDEGGEAGEVGLLHGGPQHVVPQQCQVKRLLDLLHRLGVLQRQHLRWVVVQSRMM